MKCCGLPLTDTLCYQSQTIRKAAQVVYRALRCVMNHPQNLPRHFDKCEDVKIYDSGFFEPLISYATKHTEKPVN